MNETKLDKEIKSWLAFAAQKVVEVNALAKALAGQKDEVLPSHYYLMFGVNYLFRTRQKVNKDASSYLCSYEYEIFLCLLLLT